MFAQYNEVNSFFNQDNQLKELQSINQGLELGDANIIEGKEDQEEVKDYQPSPSKLDSSFDHGAEFDSKYHLIDSKDPHFAKVKKMYLNIKDCSKVKKKAVREQQMLIEFYVSNKDETEKKKAGFDKFFFQTHLQQLLIENQEIFENLSKYMIFSEENKRFFNVSI
mmetsp:Transcript_8955/g.7956  ORF Transcript_8955/g.7956 Transcript_8955/m.7956 type:complete len:166 (+) Transcript_8955:1193-1690(+)